MPPITVAKTVTAIVERSLPVVAPFGGTLALVRGKDGRYRLGERLMDGIASLGVWPRDAQGHRLPAGHVLSRAEAERAVPTLMGLDEKAPRQRV